MKLNLGCGVFPFPYTRDNVPNPEHGEPFPDTVFEPGWVNVDKHQSAGVQECINLFRYPWVRSSNGSPFNDNSADEIWCAHILEHVPHDAKLARGLPSALSAKYAAMVEDYDGFAVFMSECWRILKPDGLLWVRFPYATCYPALADFTHTRYLVPGTFSYFGERKDTTPFNYNLPCHFELYEPYVYRFNMRYADNLGRYTSEGVQVEVMEHHYLVDEVRMTFRAVKE